MSKSSNDADPDSPQEIIPPNGEISDSARSLVINEILANINQNQFTDRPDLMLEVIEKHDPGFIKAMNEDSREFAKIERDSRFHFGKVQAYASLVLQWLVGFILICSVPAYLLLTESPSMWVLFGIAVIFAVSQSGPSGFLAVAQQIVETFKRTPKD